jgi:kinetochore protein Mis12/MTW1
MQRRRLNRLYTRAVRRSHAQLRLSQQRLSQVASLDLEGLDALAGIPEQLSRLHASMTSLPTLDSAARAALTQAPLTDPGKRQWETSKDGYLSWAVEHLVARARKQAGENGSSVVSELAMQAGEVGKAEDLRAALESAGGAPTVAPADVSRSSDEMMDTE